MLGVQAMRKKAKKGSSFFIKSNLTVQNYNIFMKYANKFVYIKKKSYLCARLVYICAHIYDILL